MSAKATKSLRNVALTSASQSKPSSTQTQSISQTTAGTTAKIGFVSTATRRGGSSSSSTQRGLSAPASSQPGKPTVARFRITPDGALLKQTHSHTWVQTIPRVDLERLDATTDTDINHQRIAELVDEALRASTSSVAQLAKSLHLSPTTIRRWRRGTASPTAANLLKLQNQISA